MDLQTLIIINPIFMFTLRGLSQLARKFACHVILSYILYFLVAYGPCSVNAVQNSPDYDACASFEKSYHFDSSDTAISDSRLGHKFPAAHNSYKNVCPNSHLFCFPSLLDGFFRDEKITKEASTEESGSQYRSPLCEKLDQDSLQASNKSWSSDFGVFRLLSGGVISCSLNSKVGVNEVPSLQSEIDRKNDISSCGGSLHKLKSTHIRPKSSEVSFESNSLDGSVSPNIKIGPTVLDWGQKYLYSSSAAFLTVENTCNESTLHLYEPFSTDLQFYPCNFSEVSLSPGESVIIYFVFFPKFLGFSSASLILQTSYGGFVVEAKGYATESPFGIQPLSGVEISPGGRLSRNFSLFNPFDEPLYVDEITAWISFSLGDNNFVETEGSCSINDFHIFDTRPSPTIKDRLVVKSSQVGSPIVAIRPHRKWDIGPHSSENLFEMDITVGFEGKIFGAFCLHLLRSSQDTSDTIMVPIEAEVDTHSVSDTLGKFISVTLEGLATCDSGEIAITISLRNDASYILSFVKVLEVADVELFHMKYKEGLLLLPGTVTQVGIIYCSHHMHLDSHKVSDLQENCKLSILTNDSTSPLIVIPCEDILHICFEHHRLSSAGIEDKSKHIEARNMRAGYVHRSTELPPSVKVLVTSVDELVLENWKSQGTMSGLSVLEDREILFPMIQVGSYVSRWITVKNPSQHPVTMQLILNSGELINECKGLHDLLNPSSSGNLVVDEGATPTKFGFSVPENALTEAYVHPYDRVTLGPVIFFPSDSCSWSGSALVRNNLSGVESIPLRGFGGSLSLVLLDERSEHVQSVDFNLKMLKPLNFSLPYSLLHTKEMTSVCSQPLVKELYAKNTGDLPLVVKSIRVSGRECGLDGFKILHCRGFALEPGESIKLTMSYQTDFSAAVMHRDLELALDTGIFLYPMKASFSHDMLSNCKKSVFWMRVKKTLSGFLLVASLLYFVFWFVSPQSTAMESLDFSPKSDNNLVNQYHIYEAIGRGRYSTVYKGRKKKTIEYFAIKSVDKSQKTKVLQEVRILHTLDHQNVLKFYSWYETSAHLWLVLEYCVGGDLLSILRQDNQLPEDSVNDLACYLIRALQYLHSNGIIYCDLKPSNILLDENGCAKLCDFGLARKLKEISKVPSSSLPQAKRGTPSYMAPELFEDGGVHSYASDFWALGCVLYECYAGRPPFVGREFTQLVKSIISDPTPPLPGNPSRPFVNLINSLLVKDPAERIQWPELCGHAFWKTKFTPVPLPPQPAFDDMIELQAKPLSEHNGDKSSQNRTPPKYREKDVKGVLKKDENSGLASRGIETPTRATPNSHRTQTKGSGRTLQKDPSNTKKGLNLLRLSRIAKSNLQKENEKENYRRPLPNGSEKDADVKIENTDMELDFNENSEEDALEETDGSEHTPSVPGAKMENNLQNQGKAEDTENDTHRLDTPSVTTPASDDSRSFDHESTPDRSDISAISPSVSPLVKKQRLKGDLGSGLDSDSSRSSNDFSQVIWHPSDLSVRPVMPSRKVDKGSEVIPSLPFEALQAPDFVKMPKEQLEAVQNRTIGILNGSTSIGDKQNVVRYLEMLSSNADAANILTNGPIMLILVKLLRQSKASALRVQLASLIGLLIRHSTFVDDSLANSGILGSLTDGLRDRHEKVRRFSMAALGELLFYISTQSADSKDNTPLESPSKDNRTAHGWQVPNSLISLVSSILKKGEDDITQLYALRTIENICSQGGVWVGRFTSQDVINNLCYIYRAAGKQESMRLTAGSCLVRLVRFNPSCIQSVVEKLSFKDLASALIKGSPREQQISLNLLNMAMLGSHMFTNVGRYLIQLAEDKNLIPSLLALVEQGSEVLRGKALVFVALLCKHGRRWLPQFFCSHKLLSVVDRLGKEKDAFVRQCLDAFLHIVASTIPGLLDIITGDIQQMMGGRRLGHISSFTSRSAPKSNIHLFPVVLHLLESSAFKHKVATLPVLRQLANLIKLVEAPFQGRDDFQITLLRILESLTEESSVILANPDIFIREILPSLTVLYKGNKDGDARFLCLKIFFDVMIILLSEPIEEEQRLNDLKFVSNTHFLPLYPTLIEDEDPIPIFAQKLLVMLLEFSFISIPDILHLKTISQCFEFLLGDLSNANVNNVKLCLALASALEMESKLLSQLKVVRRIGNFLEFVCAKGMEDLLEPTLGLCRAFLARSVSCAKGFSQTSEPTLLGDCPPEVSGAVDPQQCIRDITDFGSNVGVFLELSASRETSVADIASQCVVLLLKAAPREATTGLLTNLPKVTTILESWSKGTPHLTVQRMLHALGYACKQYLLHAMILSISIPEITRIEVIVSELKSSTVPALAKTAGLAALELQRLPRCI